MDPVIGKKIQKACGHHIDSLEQLISGIFFNQLKDIFFIQDHGLFPSPSQIQIYCDCPDYAVLCKHAASILYATSIILDNDPSLFFKLRGISMDSLISKALGENVDDLIEKSKQKSKRILEDKDLKTLFQLD